MIDESRSRSRHRCVDDVRVVHAEHITADTFGLVHFLTTVRHEATNYLVIHHQSDRCVTRVMLKYITQE